MFHQGVGINKRLRLVLGVLAAPTPQPSPGRHAAKRRFHKGQRFGDLAAVVKGEGRGG